MDTRSRATGGVWVSFFSSVFTGKLVLLLSCCYIIDSRAHSYPPFVSNSVRLPSPRRTGYTS